MKVLTAFAFIVVVATAKADDFSSNFAAVMIDDGTEARLGAFPYDRKVIADAVAVCARSRAKAVVLKFFFDRAKSVEGDAALCESMQQIPVALQARLESSEGTSAAIPERFSFGPRRLATPVRGERGWIPLQSLLRAAAAVGFVDFDSTAIPLVEEYRGTPYKSLIVCCLELATTATARISADGRVYVGGSYLPADATGMYRADLSAQPSMTSISFARLLAGEVKPEELEGHVVIIGWDSARTPTLSTQFGKMGIHRFFLECLAASYRTLKANQTLEPTTLLGTSAAEQPLVPSRVVAHL